MDKFIYSAEFQGRSGTWAAKETTLEVKTVGQGACCCPEFGVLDVLK